MRVTSEF